MARARANAGEHAWAAQTRNALVAAAQPWLDLSDEDLWGLMFGNTIRRSWQVWSDGYCPACRKPVPMYEWIPDALRQPWKMRCPQCQEWFPKNDFQKFYRSGLNAQAVFDPALADRSLLFNVEHPDASDPLHQFGVDDGEGYTADGKRWRFIGTYLIFGQWKQAIVGGIRNLAAAYVVTGDVRYAHKAGVLLDRVADLYPTFDFGREGVMYEGPPRAGYISTWHDACVEVHDLALAYDAVFDALAVDSDLVRFLAMKSAQHQLADPKSAFADIQRNIEERIFRDTLNQRSKIESNYPATDVTIITIETVLGWPGNRAQVMSMLDDIIRKATLVDGVTGEKGIAGYTVIAPHAIASLLGRYARAEPDFIREVIQRHPRLHDMYRFHLDTWCLGQYYPRTGDTGSFAERSPNYAGLAFSQQPGIEPSSYTFLWTLYEVTRDPDFVRLLYGANGNATDNLPYDLFAVDPAGFQTHVAQVIAEQGARISLPSVNKTEWSLAILRSGDSNDGRAVWLDYDSGERHGHADAMTLGLFAKGLDLLPDFGYPPVQYGGWTAPRAVWYTQTAAHNTVAVDDHNTQPGRGQTTLWFDGVECRTIRASGPALTGGQQYERTVALVDISAQDAYVLDVFRATGGTNQTKCVHGSFGELSAQGLSLRPTGDAPFGPVMRNLRRDANPAEGWSVDWKVKDHLRYLPDSADVHLRFTDLTRGAEVGLCETWVSVSHYGGTAEAWVPSVLIRRWAASAPLSSTFVGVLEPYEGHSNLATIRRLSLPDAGVNPLADGDIGVEVCLNDGRRDVFLSANVEARSGSDASMPAAVPVLQPEPGCAFRGRSVSRSVQRITTSPNESSFCRGKSLQAGNLIVKARSQDVSFELDLRNTAAPIVAGAADAVELIDVAGTRLWPK